MDPESLPADLQEAIRFHGHLCPGLSIGYRAARIALERLAAARAEDEELIAIVENDSCSVDAVQWMTGCTFGKGNFFFRDHGKQVFTFAVRPSGRAVRIALKPRPNRPPLPEGNRDAAVEQMLHAPAEDLFTVEECTITLPAKASIHESLICERCGEAVVATRTETVGAKVLCAPCAHKLRNG